MAMKLQIIICSTRPGRIGPAIATWFNQLASEYEAFENSLIDLADFELPVYNEPHHPATQQYQHETTKAWSQSVQAADAYVFVLPEYNGCPPPTFFNALDYVYKEWNYKPCAFVSYGGVSGGLRSVITAKQLVTTLRMVPIVEGVVIQMPWDRMDDQHQFQAADVHLDSAQSLLDELAKWAKALSAMR